MTQRILAVESDRITRLVYEMHLQQAGYGVVGVDHGETALDLLAREHFDLLMTELILPNICGMRLIAAARALSPRIAVIIITGDDSTASMMAAIKQQVHDYLIKPISPPALIRQVSEVLHRQIAERGPGYRLPRPEPLDEPIINIGPLQIDRPRHRVTCGGQAIRLSNGEYSLLIYLAQRRGMVVSPQDIVRDVLHYTCSLHEARELAKSHIHRLRRKIEAPLQGLRLIHNVRGAGYRLLDESDTCH